MQEKKQEEAVTRTVEGGNNEAIKEELAEVAGRCSGRPLVCQPRGLDLSAAIDGSLIPVTSSILSLGLSSMA